MCVYIWFQFLFLNVELFNVRYLYMIGWTIYLKIFNAMQLGYLDSIKKPTFFTIIITNFNTGFQLSICLIFKDYEKQ